jgi:glycine C-acetyltransferase
VIFKGGINQTTHLIKDLRKNYGIFCSVVIYPVVPKGVIMLRIIPTASHTLEDVKYTIDCFKEVKKKLESGAYPTDTMADFKN